MDGTDERSRRRSDRTDRAGSRTVRAVLLVVTLLPSGCAPRPLPPPAIRQPVATGPAAIPSPATPAAKLREEPLDLGPAPAAAPSPTADPGADRSLPLPATDAGANPRSAAATRLAAEARNRMSAGDDSAALEQLERAISVDPENGYAYCLLAEVQSRRGSFDQSILFAERAAALLNDRDPRWASHAHTVGAAAFETVGRFADARLAYRRALDLDPSNAEAHAGFARAGGQEGGR